MKMKIVVVLLSGLMLFVIFNTGCFEKENEKKSVTKKDALDFSLKIVNTYLTGNRDEFIGYLADTLYTLEGEGPFTKEEVVNSIMEEDPFPAGEDYSGYTLDDYLENYNPKIMNYDEYTKEYPDLPVFDSFENWKPDYDDFLFIGNEVKPGKEAFIWDDLLIFMVTYQNQKWEFIAFSG